MRGIFFYSYVEKEFLDTQLHNNFKKFVSPFKEHLLCQTHLKKKKKVKSYIQKILTT